jgi:hypothetical protein
MYINMHAKLQGAIAMNKTKLVKILAEGGIDVNNNFNSSLTPILLEIIQNSNHIVGQWTRFEDKGFTWTNCFSLHIHV